MLADVNLRLAAAAVVLCTVSGCLAQTPTGRAAAAVTQLMRWYDAREGQFSGIGWWHTGNVLTTLCEYSIYTKNTSYVSIVADMYTKNQNFTTEGYDDEGWWGLAWMDAYSLTHEKTYLTIAESVFADMAKAWDDTCGGGIWWDRKRTYKNAITNELFLALATKLYLATQNATYRTWAQQEWKWFAGSGMINSKYLINDGLTMACKNNGDVTWTYNQGVVIGGLVDLHRITQDPAYLVQAGQIVNATITSLVTPAGILQELCEKARNCDGDQIQFKGIFMRNLGYLYSVTKSPLYASFIQKNAVSIWNADRSGNSLGFYWSGPFDSADAARQSSALDTLNVATLI